MICSSVVENLAQQSHLRKARTLQLARPIRALLVVIVLAVSAPVAIAADHRRPAPTKPDISRGEALFVGNCSGCHTFKAAAATAIEGPDLDKYPPPSLAYAKYQITHGGGIMPAFTRFNAQQVADIAAFVWTKRQSRNANTTATNAATGKELFKANCGSCHTLKAAGTTGAVGPNLDTKHDSLARIIKQITGGGRLMPPFGTAMGGPLTDARIKAIAAFVLASH